MTTLLTQWGDRPHDSCPDPPEWPDFSQVISRPAQPMRAPQPVPQRPAPLVTVPYQPLGFKKTKRTRRRRRTPAAVTTTNSTAPAAATTTNSAAPAAATTTNSATPQPTTVTRRGGRTTGRRGRRQQPRQVLPNNTSSSSEAEFIITRRSTRVNARRRHIICSSTSTNISTSSDDEPLGDVNRRYHRYPIGTGVRRKFDSGWFDGEVIEIHAIDKLWTVKYTDGDKEDLNEDQLIRYSSQYNQKHNSK